MHVVIRIVDLPRFAHAGTAGASIDETDVQRAAEYAREFVRRGPVCVHRPFEVPLPSHRFVNAALTAEAMDAAALIDCNAAVLARNCLRRASRDQFIGRGCRLEDCTDRPTRRDTGRIIAPSRVGGAFDARAQPFEYPVCHRIPLSIALGVRQSEACENYWEVLKCKILRRDVEA